MLNLLFYGSTIFQLRSYTCYIHLFLSFENNYLSVVAVQERYEKGIYLGQSRDCGNLALVKVNSSLWISFYFYCFYVHEFILWLQYFWTVSHGWSFYRSVSLVCFLCQFSNQKECLKSISTYSKPNPKLIVSWY